MEGSSKTSTSRARNADATRADLLRAAKRRFTVLGYERTTTRDIATDAGANVSLITRYFGSKEGLFASVLAESAGAVDHPSIDSDEDLVGQIVSSLRTETWAEYGGEHPLVLLTRDSGEGDAIRSLRQQGLQTAVEHFSAELDKRSASSDQRARRMHAELLLSLVAGLVAFRSALPDGLLANASEAELRLVIERFLASAGEIPSTTG